MRRPARLGPMHDQTQAIRSLVSRIGGEEAANRWSVQAVPNGVRVNFQCEKHYAATCAAATKAGYQLIQYRSAPGVQQSDYAFLVTGWDGNRLQQQIKVLERTVIELNAALAGAPELAIDRYEEYRMLEGRDRPTAKALALDEVKEQIRIMKRRLTHPAGAQRKQPAATPAAGEQESTAPAEKTEATEQAPAGELPRLSVVADAG